MERGLRKGSVVGLRVGGGRCWLLVVGCWLLVVGCSGGGGGTRGSLV